MTSPALPPLTIRLALPHELASINARYAEIDFVPSSQADTISVAEVDGIAAGLGRVVPIAPGIGELGGMLVFDAFKGRGISRRIISFLFEHSSAHTLYCIPFAELEQLYASLGFARVDDGPEIPRDVALKYRWCNEHYPKPALLMRLVKPRPLTV